MSEDQWISAFIQQASNVMLYWNVYIVVVLGIVGFVIQKGDGLSVKDRWIFVVAFVLFAFSNAIPMYSAQESLLLIHENIQNSEVFSASDPVIVLSAHVVFDVLLVVFLLLPVGASDIPES